MSGAIERVLAGQAENHILPFFWQHHEEEAVLREMMSVIHEAGCGAVCVESRPHPDFCGKKWWQDMDIILDEARKRNMKVWILDDSHFPTGFANDGLKNQPDSLCRQNIFLREKTISRRGKVVIDLKKTGLLKQKKNKTEPFDKVIHSKSLERIYMDDSILSVTARRGNEILDLTEQVQGDILTWDKPEGSWILSVVVRSRNTGSHRNYINMTEEESCRVLIERVYEPHWEHYAADFGKTIAGFFSDEPELGNGRAYPRENFLGTDQDLPWGTAVEAAVSDALGEGWRGKIYLLWRDGAEAQIVHSKYMDILTKRVRSSFSRQIAEWCHTHGVQYIGHVIEDDGQHCRTGSSLGHYFRGLQYQDMAGIDDIGGQVYPQGEDEPTVDLMRQPRNGEFYHYGLAKLAQSAAAIEYGKNGNAMCEIFGNYGWSEGVKLEKYLADHFLVRGINYFVPHAFTGKAFPDPDCPPHFYAHGHNPQYRHFGELMNYMNRVATLISSGRHRIPVAILYHGDSEWADSSAMPFEKPLRVLYDHQIDCHTVPADIFCEPEYYHVTIGNPLIVNEQRYDAFVVPGSKVLPKAAAEGMLGMLDAGLPMFFVEQRPLTIAETGDALPDALCKVPCIPLAGLYPEMKKISLPVPVLAPANDRLRVLHIKGDTEMFFVVNESKEIFHGKITVPVTGECCAYDPWFNTCVVLDFAQVDKGTEIELTVEPLKPQFIVFGNVSDVKKIRHFTRREVMVDVWERSICEGKQYPNFEYKKQVSLPDRLAQEMPKFSGFVRYETDFSGIKGEQILLEISDASEGVEVFLNDRSLGIQIAEPYRYELTEGIENGSNRLIIEVATTLERQAYPMLDPVHKMMSGKPTCESGLIGTVKLLYGN